MSKKDIRVAGTDPDETNNTANASLESVEWAHFVNSVFSNLNSNGTHDLHARTGQTGPHKDLFSHEKKQTAIELRQRFR